MSRFYLSSFKEAYYNAISFKGGYLYTYRISLDLFYKG